MLLEGKFDPELIAYLIISILIGFTVHEFSHAAVAHLLGDSTPKRQGRLTLSPVVHIDIIGFLMFVIMGFGWAKPVEVDTNQFRNPRRDDLLVSLAGPASNFIVAFILARLYFLPMSDAYDKLLSVMIFSNVILAVFNLLPVPPLDGSRIITYFLPERARAVWETIEQYSLVLFMVLIFSGVTEYILSGPVDAVLNLAYIGMR
jgi:Zn-dependent protease